ncbi:hypothetical protein [Silvanigrella aquatica]|uniref:Uncharacterized protein n=1 Tax=Silvanigrella aquatica TaxID=1915309 RepID=A0A1L4CZL2_9BACT|nr:hypothetical protein [Silvanigrella aquatica]APJ03403.1 hypothetical protein AXG55_05580 [Silvanigrella aquatica]
MADVRVNGKRIPPLQSIDTLSALMTKLESIAQRNNSSVTALCINNSSIDLDNPEFLRLKLENEDTVDAKLDTAEQLSYESLQVALDMAGLLVFDLKVVTLKLWDSEKNYEKSLETLLNDCNLFLSLGARPIYLLNKDPEKIEPEAQTFLKQLDAIAYHVEDATLLAVHGHAKDACYVLVGMVKPAIERWIGMSAKFAQILEINTVSNELLIS